jgi:hypothetical protein
MYEMCVNRALPLMLQRMVPLESDWNPMKCYPHGVRGVRRRQGDRGFEALGQCCGTARRFQY